MCPRPRFRAINPEMSENEFYPFTIEVAPLTSPKGKFGWAIRKHGKLLERSDRPHDSEERAYASATAAVERAFRPADPRRR
ncbi:hypothetical protein mvi_08490 [Methylobacterium indicum]|uniref:Uncharacterized protein n=4 Tax=Methylobacterium TaxID=407 RepID=A0A8H8WQ87_9HYPH|nr:hypothetical protein mvi_08490 [Methylobacterium indicum]